MPRGSSVTREAISGHNNYWLWGYGETNGELLITLGFRRSMREELYDSVEQEATVVSPYAEPTETNLPIYVCRVLKMPMEAAWRRMKRFI